MAPPLFEGGVSPHEEHQSMAADMCRKLLTRSHTRGFVNNEITGRDTLPRMFVKLGEA